MTDHADERGAGCRTVWGVAPSPPSYRRAAAAVVAGACLLGVISPALSGIADAGGPPFPPRLIQVGQLDGAGRADLVVVRNTQETRTVAVSADTGRVLWDRPTPALGYVTGVATTGRDNAVLLVDGDGTFFRFWLTVVDGRGNTVWTQKVEARPAGEHVSYRGVLNRALAADLLLVQREERVDGLINRVSRLTLELLDAGTGVIARRLVLPAMTGVWQEARPIGDLTGDGEDDLIVLGLHGSGRVRGDETASALNGVTGELLWRTPARVNYDTSLSHVDGRILLSTFGGSGFGAMLLEASDGSVQADLPNDDFAETVDTRSGLRLITLKQLGRPTPGQSRYRLAVSSATGEELWARTLTAPLNDNYLQVELMPAGDVDSDGSDDIHVQILAKDPTDPDVVEWRYSALVFPGRLTDRPVPHTLVSLSWLPFSELSPPRRSNLIRDARPDGTQRILRGPGFDEVFSFQLPGTPGDAFLASPGVLIATSDTNKALVVRAYSEQGRLLWPRVQTAPAIEKRPRRVAADTLPATGAPPLWPATGAAALALVAARSRRVRRMEGRSLV